MTNLSAMMSSDRMDWQTPDAVLDRVRKIAPIGLDPCTTDENPTGAEFCITPEINGLVQPWGDCGLVFVNPVYGRGIVAWTAKAAAEVRLGTEVCILLPARTDTAWFHEHVWKIYQRIAFWRGRLVFKGAPASAPFPSCVAYAGTSTKRLINFVEAFSDRCYIVMP